ncbi:Phosphatidylserine decarboxylase [Plasmopara halstedii]|uniref:phosphatidylserine decarboxylase n=1 Tax=Plasmopara halstedii TaxID=4781 RepID=A0A0P1AX89_PLAHL|nr:Phosphatidylserine decarboxylase [Plasmopara halstedii]CEG46263.1 Phosphatidylserine decarboxylase [Plasmopara halstedii]|eukprot:XP_024582632.1 Phosphatidylserine decarboxylase [Plasmopara halstedii]
MFHFAQRCAGRGKHRRHFSQRRQNRGSNDIENPSASIFPGNWKIPAAIGFALIGFLQWQHLNHPSDEERKKRPASALRRLPGENTAFEKTMATERQMQSLKLFPSRAVSRLWGQVHDKELPRWMRKPVYKAWTAVFKCNLDEMKYPLDDYANLSEFFSRPLKSNARSFDFAVNHLASPIDAPGDYHRIHAPTDWQVKERRHFPGNLFPVNHIAARLIPSLFVENERVALLGEWKHGFFSLTAVGALNVGSITLAMEPNFGTNTAVHDKQLGHCFKNVYGVKMDAMRGEEMAQFKLGSTVVLVFEAPKSFQFTVKLGDRVTLGNCIGEVD